MMLLGLCGYARSGKDTAYNNLPGKWKRLAFADKLKNDLEPLLNQVNASAFDDTMKDRTRPLMVAWGATARMFEPDHWLSHVMEAIEEHILYDYYTGICVTDVRYVNEVSAILDRGGTVIRILRDRTYPINTEEELSFSEIDMKHSLPVITNNGTPQHLAAKIMEKLK